MRGYHTVIKEPLPQLSLTCCCHEIQNDLIFFNDWYGIRGNVPVRCSQTTHLRLQLQAHRAKITWVLGFLVLYRPAELSTGAKYTSSSSYQAYFCFSPCYFGFWITPFALWTLPWLPFFWFSVYLDFLLHCWIFCLCGLCIKLSNFYILPILGSYLSYQFKYLMFSMFCCE